MHITGLTVAAGGVLLEDGQVLLVYRPRYQDWSLPKGKLDDGESPREAAVREVQEETGYSVEPVRFLGAFGYEVKGQPKVVLYWLMRPLGQGPIEDAEEVAELRWLPLADALEKLSYPLERDLLARLPS
jgi:8-oxo-dGTP diphosphatase